jgi:hypothetical protein
VLLALADLGYPAGDTALPPMCDEVLGRWLDGRYFVSMGGVNTGRMNEWVTADALGVLAASGR